MCYRWQGILNTKKLKRLREEVEKVKGQLCPECRKKLEEALKEDYGKKETQRQRG